MIVKLNMFKLCGLFSDYQDRLGLHPRTINGFLLSAKGILLDGMALS